MAQREPGGRKCRRSLQWGVKLRFEETIWQREEVDPDADDEASGTESVDQDDDDCVALDIDGLVDVDPDDWDLDLVLPPHQRCAAHILNLLGSADAKAALDRNAAYKKIHDQTDEKLRTCWRRQNQSTLVAEAIQAGLGVKLQIPGETRWNSEYDAKAQIVKILDGVNGEEKFGRTLEAAGLPKLTSTEAKYLKEFVWVMEPVAIALDILQKDRNMYMGYLLPTIQSLETQLRIRREREGRPLKYCDILFRTLLEAVRQPRRFQTYLCDIELQVAACLLPRFKLDWISDEGVKAECKAKILRELASLSPKEALCPASQSEKDSATPASASVELEGSDEEAEDDPDPSTSTSEGDGSDTEVPVDAELSFEDSFYGVAVLPPVENTEEGEETAAQELERFLQTPRSVSVEDCFAIRPCGTRKFPRLAQMFLKYNVGVPSSASVERLFWQAGTSFSDLRNNLGDNSLEREVLLRVNKQYWNH
ncbi:Myosin-binding protein C, cardiac-type [Frankliniella fusca]|uniref:Myosin-binding protein C, cardiac-type n=1 Tax=Frankliniella fusca TaxID=407009 RepID=A0AAE1HCK0_9NEOP|nr:Myosin-binding protein C, cardiac-type [Frankliniella fusca]